MVSAALRRQVLLSEEEKRRQLKIKINIACFTAKEEEPLVKFGALIRLHHKNGVDVNERDIMRGSLPVKLKATKYLSGIIDRD